MKSRGSRLSCGSTLASGSATALAISGSNGGTVKALTIIRNLSLITVAGRGMMGVPGNLGIPNAMGVLPGMTAFATKLMKDKMETLQVPCVREYLQMLVDAGAKLYGCKMSVDMMDLKKEDFIDGIEYGGAATFLKFAGETDVCLFI